MTRLSFKFITQSIKQKLLFYYHLKRSQYLVDKSYRLGKTQLSFSPSSINMMMIDLCNSQCIMCGSDYKCEGSSERINLEKVKRIYSHLCVNELYEVIYGGGGEPFLNHELGDIAEYTRFVIPHVQHTVITNLVYYNGLTVTKLLNAGANVLISCNAASESTYKEISGIHAFNQVIENIKKIIEASKRLNSDSSITLSIILMRQNIAELSQFIQMAHDLGVKRVKAMYVRIYPEHYRKKTGKNNLIAELDSLFYHKSLSNKEINNAKNLAKKLKIKFEHPPLFGQIKPPVPHCKDPWKSIFINFNGDLFPCAAGEIMFMKKVLNKKYQTGNILEKPIEEIWNNSFWQELRKTNLKKYSDKRIPECSCCGCSIEWLGPDEEHCHIMKWEDAERSNLTL